MPTDDFFKWVKTCIRVELNQTKNGRFALAWRPMKSLAAPRNSSSTVGMRAVVMDDVTVETGAMVAAGALVPPRKRVTAGEVWAGTPAKALRAVSPAEKHFMEWSPLHYQEIARGHMEAGEG